MQMQVMISLMKKFGSKGGEGGKGLNDTGSSGDGKPSSMETVPGPLGQAMQDKRIGEEGGSSA